VILVAGTMFAKHKLTKNEVTLNIRGMKVIVKEGDILTSNGWKLIPFNEYFDTQVDDVIIARSSLNGKYIDSLGDDDKEALKLAIVADKKSPLQRYDSSDGTKTRYELGTIKVFQDVMMLALTHFNAQNEAHTNRAEYEHTLRKMWKEIRRTHQGKSIHIPLIGGGLTQLDDLTEKPNEQLLKCILCTLRTSSITFDENVQITIVLTKKALETVNLYELKGEK
ncbi:MAG: macro domain-containing protein, partial [Desulfosporosinus sp.]